MNIVWSSEARRSLRAIRRYIAQDSDFYAGRMVARIVERIERAAAMPSAGHPVHEFPEEPLKEVHESPYRIIYGYSESEFRVVTIVHFQGSAYENQANPESCVTRSRHMTLVEQTRE